MDESDASDDDPADEEKEVHDIVEDIRTQAPHFRGSQQYSADFPLS